MIADTGLFIAHLLADGDATEILLAHRGELVVPFVVHAELLAGARQSTRAIQEERRIRALLSAHVVLWPVI